MCSSLLKLQLAAPTGLFLLCRSSAYPSIHEVLFRTPGITISGSILCACSVECIGTCNRAYLRKIKGTIDATGYLRDTHINGDLLVQELKQVVYSVTLKQIDSWQ